MDKNPQIFIGFLFYDGLRSNTCIIFFLSDKMIFITHTFICTQVFIFGIHHTGTSIAANLTMELGFNGGTFDEFVHHSTNPLKFWERKDVVDLNKKRLMSGSQCLSSQLTKPTWAGFHFQQSCGQPIFEQDVVDIIQKINQSGTPWVIKEPRMSLFASEWLHVVENPMCLIVIRNKMETVQSLIKFSSHHNLYDWGQLYNDYYEKIEKDCLQNDAHVLKVYHNELMNDPFDFMEKVYQWTTHRFHHKITLPSFERNEKIKNVLSKYKSISNKLVTNVFEEKALEHSPNLPNFTFAFATILTTENLDYLKGTLVLGASIRNFYSNQDMICLVTSKVPLEWYAVLEKVGWTVKLVQTLPEYRWKFCNGFTEDQSQRWGNMMTKLRIWELSYERIVYIDSDAILLRPIPTNLFEPTFSAEKGVHHPFFNAGVMIITPSSLVLQDILEYAKNEAPEKLFGNSVDCTEQAVLVEYFSNSAHLFNVAHGYDDLDQDSPNKISEDIFAVHWITHACRKPWMEEISEQREIRQCTSYFYQYWNKLWTRVSFHFEQVYATTYEWEIGGRRLRQIREEEYEVPYSYYSYYSYYLRRAISPLLIFVLVASCALCSCILIILNKLVTDVIEIKKMKNDGFQELGNGSTKIECAESSSDEEDEHTMKIKQKN